MLTPGAGVVTTRNHIHWLVTEHGAVDLYGKTLQERARLVISIAHPSAQEELDRAAFERFGSHHHYIKGYMSVINYYATRSAPVASGRFFLHLYANKNTPK